MSNLVIVAIPDENDRVWKISSEKIPHLTLLFLGESDQVGNTEQIVQFVEHAANQTLRRFYLPVDRRDELGNDPDLGPADVLFFKKGRYDYKAIRDFRVTLLKDDNIRTAYDTASQHEGVWLPHLTLGYENRPAKPDDTDRDFGFYDVSFNKIAVWLDDFDGPEFLLKDYWDEWEALETVPMDVAMSSIRKPEVEPDTDPMAQTAELGVEFLEHFGVRGMKWGTRNPDSSKLFTGGSKKADLKRAVVFGPLAPVSTVKTVGRGLKALGKGLAALGAELSESSWQSSVYNDAKHEAVHNSVAKELDNKIVRLQSSPKYKGKNLRSDSDLRKKYYEDVSKVTDSAYRRGVKNVYGDNYKGDQSAHYVHDARGPRIEVRSKQSGEVKAESPVTSQVEIKRRRAASAAEAEAATHAATTTVFPDLSIELKLDDNGQISGVGFVKPSEEAMAQSIDLGAVLVSELLGSDEKTLEHYGVRGMRWGVRNEPLAVATTATSRVPHGTKSKTKIKTKGGENHPAHEDAIKVAEARAKLGKSGPAALSNNELRDVANRLQLEQQVKQLTTSGGKKFVSGLLKGQGNQSANRVIARKLVTKGF